MANLALFNQTIKAPNTQEYLQTVLGENRGSFVTSLVSIVGNNAQLAACDPKTIMYGALKAASLQLPFDPNLGFAYLIPYKNKGVDEAQFQLGYKGLIQLAQRSGQYAYINADSVCEGEISKRDKLTGNIELDGERTSDKIVGYFAYFELLNGFKKTLYMTIDEVRAHANRFSQTAKRGYGLWADKDSFDAMAKKTVLKMLISKYGPMSVEMQSAMTADQAVYHDAAMNEEYVDNEEPEEQRNEQVEAIKNKAQGIKRRARAVTAKVEPNTAFDEQPEETPAPTIDDMPEEMFAEEV